jgi:hypothetical protein
MMMENDFLEKKYFLAMKIFLKKYYDIYGPADETLPSLLSNIGRSHWQHYLPPDPALWQMWEDSILEVGKLVKDLH